jgi:hypothetical protein
VSGADPLGVEGETAAMLQPLHALDASGDGRVDLLRVTGDTFGQVRLEVFRNHTYGEGSPFVDLGHALSDPGWAGAPATDSLAGMQLATPILLAEGDLQPGTEVALRVLRHGVESEQAWFVLGDQALLAPLQGGTFVPYPTLLVGPLALPGADDVFELTTTVPADLPAGLEFWMQAWFVPGGPQQDFAATSAVRATTP